MSNDNFKAEASPRTDKLLSVTAKGNLRLNATRRNPRSKEDGQPATKAMDQIFEYFYITPKGVVTFKQLGKEEITGWPADYKPKGGNDEG